MDDKHLIELEMSYTKWDQSCRNPHITPEGDLRECRRTAGHTDNGTLCASGFGSNLVTWRKEQ